MLMSDQPVEDGGFVELYCPYCKKKTECIAIVHSYGNIAKITIYQCCECGKEVEVEVE